MPLKEYKCDECGLTEEMIFKTSEVQPDTVPCCCGNLLKKVKISKTSFFLVGDNWANNGYSKPAKEKEKNR